MFDCNIHLPYGSDSLDDRWCDEGTMGQKELISCFNHHLPILQKKITAGNFMLFNESLRPDEAEVFTALVRKEFSQARFTILGNFRSSNGIKQLQDLNSSGIDAVKFHCYFQHITESDFPDVLTMAIVAANLDMPIFIDTSYGSLGMYQNDNLKLAIYLLEKISNVPIVLLHSGGARVLEAHLLADACPNVYLETSFTLPYYLGSSVERDLAFSYKKISEKVIYGSDFPYIEMDESINTFLKFTRDWNFTQDQVESFLNTNIKKIFGD